MLVDGTGQRRHLRRQPGLVHPAPIDVAAGGADLFDHRVDADERGAHRRDAPLGGLPLPLGQVLVQRLLAQVLRGPLRDPRQLPEQPLLEVERVGLHHLVRERVRHLRPRRHLVGGEEREHPVVLAGEFRRPAPQP
ncbi:hypothetical protein [Streptomyces albogriseolus]|uniref:hypothetical protein n=1 Tax=Streptomyces albogriseolus TaxID=1887 RepID=UPI0034604835